MHYIELKNHLSGTAFIKFHVMHSSLFFHLKWRRLEGRLSIYSRKKHHFLITRPSALSPNRPQELTHYNIFLIKKKKRGIKKKKKKICLYFLIHRFSNPKSFFPFHLCQDHFCNFLYFQGVCCNYGRVSLMI